MVSLHDVTTEGAVDDFVTGTQLAFFLIWAGSQYKFKIIDKSFRLGYDGTRARGNWLRGLNELLGIWYSPLQELKWCFFVLFVY